MLLDKIQKRLFRTPGEGAKTWRDRISLTFAVTCAVAVGILVAGGTAGYVALDMIHKNKLMDTWAIMFLELEQQGTRLHRELVSAQKMTRAQDILFAIDAAQGLVPLQGPIEKKLSSIDLGFEAVPSAGTLPDLNVVEYAGSFYLMEVGPSQLYLRSFDRNVFDHVLANKSSHDAAAYVLTREGKLLYGSSPEMGGVNVIDRPLVQRFIQAPLSHGQLSFRSREGEDYYGFFLELPGTNLILFAEIPQATVLASVTTLIWRFAGVLLGILFFVLLAIQMPLVRMTRPLRDLARISAAVGRGQFDASPGRDGLGEVRALSSAFQSMIHGLKTRDQSIRQLMHEHVEKVRLQGEMKVAQGIQSNLLIAKNLPAAAKLAIGARYIPATECAGDWYSYHYNEKTQETFIAIADVSGHGAGSSMFTAIIAGVFDRYCMRDDDTWQLEDFCDEVNGVFRRLGKGSIHATMILARYHAETSTMDLVIAGHNPPVLAVGAPDGSKSMKRILLPSGLLGLDSHPQYGATSITFPPGSSLLLYTDGVPEARNAAGKQLGEKRLAKAFAQHMHLAPDKTIDRVVKTWEAHRAGQPVLDDSCLLLIKAVA